MPHTLLWIALPAGYTESGKLRVSAFMSPRLTGGSRLGAFPAFTSANAPWTRRVRDLKFQLQSASGPAAVLRLEDASRLRDDLWTALFNDNTRVRSYQFEDLAGYPVHSFSVQQTHSALEALYTERLTAVIDPARTGRLTPSPAVASLANIPPSAGRALFKSSHADPTAASTGSFRGLAQSGQRPGRAPSVAEIGAAYGVSPQAAALLAPQLHYSRRPADAVKRAAPKAPEPDFHEFVGTLGGYPELLRALGFVLDFVLDTDLPGGPNQWISLVPDGPSTVHRTARTAYQKGDKTFTAAPRPEGGLPLRDGMLRLDDDHRFFFYQGDVDGAALKVGMQAEALKTATGDHGKTSREDESHLPPAARSGGLAVAFRGRDDLLGTTVLANRALNTAFTSPAPPLLYAEQVTRGFCVDIKAAGQPWRSLCRRTGRYRLASGSVPIASEAYVSMSAVDKVDNGPAEKALFLHENLFTWDGWSLAAARPGKMLVETKAPAGQPAERLANPREEPTTPAAQAFGLEVYAVAEKGTLPRLRFGETYRARVRVVDLAGNAVPHTVADDSTATRAQRFVRHEPLEPPVLVPRIRYTEGESLERLVIRSDGEGGTPEAYAARPDVQAFTQKYGLQYRATAERHVAAPKTYVAFAELHGALDRAIGSDKAAAEIATTFTLIEKLEAGTFFKGLGLGAPTGMKIEGRLPGMTIPVPAAYGEPLPEGAYVCHDADAVPLPYLGDPVVRGAAFFGEANAFGEIDYGGTFANVRPGRFVLAAPPANQLNALPAAPQVHLGGGGPPPGPPPLPAVPLAATTVNNATVLTARLQPGEMRTLRYSSLPDKDVLAPQDYALLQLANAQGTANAHRQLMEQGRHPMLTPARTLTLVHAVQKPTSAPSFVELDPMRLPLSATTFNSDTPAQLLEKTYGQTYALLRGKANLSVRSTGRVDVMAEWDDIYDDGRNPDGATVVTQGGRTCEWPIAPYYSNETQLAFPQPTPQWSDEVFKHDFGDTKHRHVRYRLVAVSRYRDYFPPEIYHDEANISRTGPARAEHVASTKRPDAPKVVDVVPSFSWQTETQGNVVISRRCGGSVRVFLDRPWYSSGADELLGVLLVEPSQIGGVDDASTAFFTSLVTGLAHDPTTVAAPQAVPAPVAGMFVNATRKEKVILVEDGGREAWVAGYPVHFDRERQLWYADIQMTLPDAYMPFVRFSLVRYQPYAIPTAKVSARVLAPFIQPVPTRAAAVSRENDTTLRVTVGGAAALGAAALQFAPNLNASVLAVPTQSTPEGQALVQNVGRRFVVALEGRATEADAWGPVPGVDEVTLARMAQADAAPGRFVWSGLVDAKKPLADLPRHLRLFLREEEAILLDRAPDADDRYDAPRLSWRLVYADTISLSSGPSGQGGR